jgi:hypothetical protein
MASTTFVYASSTTFVYYSADTYLSTRGVEIGPRGYDSGRFLERFAGRALVHSGGLRFVYCSRSRREGDERSGDGPQGVADRRGDRYGDRHLVHALHRDARFRDGDTGNLQCMDNTPLDADRDPGIGTGAVYRRPAPHGNTPATRRRLDYGHRHRFHALHRNGGDADAGHYQLRYLSRLALGLDRH